MSTKDRLVEAGLGLLESDGPESLNARKVSAAIGASTMTVYTHFGGMGGLYEAIVLRAFVHFGETLAAVERTGDPVADLLALGGAYREFALASPQRYRLMFGVTAPGSGVELAHDITEAGTPTGMAEIDATFEQLVEAVRRSLAAGRIRGDDPVGIAGQFWSLCHGFVLLEMSGFFGRQGQGVARVLAPHARNLLVGLGDAPEATDRSMRAVLESNSDPAAPEFGTAGVRPGRRPQPPEK
jgi:AcrR family transcriptional regulator